tara:strand:+ start:39866 stop:40270 length:405 start_codon:yes stop_codon:yes gene_type:complete
MEKKNWAIVDDDLIFHLTTQTFIERRKIHKRVFLFHNGKEAIDYLFEHKKVAEELPDIILLDINMPIMDGWDFLEEYLPLKSELPKEIVIYIVSSSLDRDDFERAKTISAVKNYVIKPIDQSKLDEIIDELKAA